MSSPPGSSWPTPSGPSWPGVLDVVHRVLAVLPDGQVQIEIQGAGGGPVVEIVPGGVHADLVQKKKYLAEGKSQEQVDKLDLKDDVLRRANGFYTYFAWGCWS